MKFKTAICSFVLIAAASGSAYAASGFEMAAQLLSAARAGDSRAVGQLVASGADVNFIDSTGLSVVCTAIMNNDVKAAQILQMYGADSSNCDSQIKKYKQKQPQADEGGIFSDLSSAQGMALTAGGTVAVAAGLMWLGGAFDSTGGGTESDTDTGRPTQNGDDDGDGTSTAWSLRTLPAGPIAVANYNLDYYSPTDETDIRYKDFNYFDTTGIQNYLLMMHGYSPMARGYLGMRTIRKAGTDREPFSLSGISYSGHTPGGGKPVNVALITTNGINPTGSAQKGWLVWAECTGGTDQGCTSANASSSTVSSKYYNDEITKVGDDLDDWSVSGEKTGYDLSGNGTVFNSSATAYESMLAKIIAGWYADGRADGDYLGFIPNGQLTIYRTGGGVDNVDGTIDIYNWRALRSAAALVDGGTNLVTAIANASIVSSMRNAGTMTLSDIAASTGSASLTDSEKRALYSVMINQYYNLNTDDDATEYTPGVDAGLLLNSISSTSPLLIFSTGEFQLGTGVGQSLAIKEATFENFAPALYENLNHLFMSVVAVQLADGTSSFSTISGYAPSSSNKITLSVWADNNGTTEDTTDDKYYSARVCGMAGKGTSDVDPWCFSAAGSTGEAAVASMAGAAGAIKSAFSYMDSKQIFALLALTADGPYLATTTDGTSMTDATLASYLQGIYSLPNEYQLRVDNGEDYLDVFSEVYGYGLINLERATKPGTTLYYYDGTKIVSSTGDAFWRSATTRTTISPSAALGSRAATIKTPFYDILESVDGSLSLPRVWENEFSLSAGKRGLYLGDILGDLQTDNEDIVASSDDSPLKIKMSFSNSTNNDNMSGLSELAFSYESDDRVMAAKYQRHFSDAPIKGLTRSEMNNPILSLAGRAISAGAVQSFGKMSLSARAVSGVITDETLLENDPAVSSDFEALRLGSIMGVESGIGYNMDKVSFSSSVGVVHESNTILGTYTDGLMNMGGGDTTYVDNLISFMPFDDVKFTARATFAQTKGAPTGELITSLSTIDSNAWSLGAEIGQFAFAVSQPLAVQSGNMQYATADYNVVENADGNYELESNPYIANLNLSPEMRETRFSGAYRMHLGPVTTGALGYIYRLHPNHTDEFGNESIFMMKINHKIGI